MKNALLLLSLTAGSFIAEARHPAKIPGPNTTNAPDAAIYQNILCRQLESASSAMKGTGTMLRLKAHAYFDIAGSILKDTTYYTYSNGRGSTHPANASYYSSFVPLDIDNKQYILCDTIFSRTDYQGTGSLNLALYSFKYDSKNNVTNYKTFFASYLYDYKLTYDVNSRLTSVSITDETMSPPKATTSVYMHYNAKGQRDADSFHNIQTNMPSSKREYVYDNSGNKISFLSYQYQNNQWKLSFRSNYTYDANNRIVTKTSEYEINGALTLVSMDSFGYTGSAAQYTHFSTHTRDLANGVWKPADMQTYNLTSAGQIDTYYIYSWNNIDNQWDTVERDAYFYNNNLLQYTHGYMYQGNGVYSATPYDKMTYYYEEYDPAGITTNPISKAAVILYPNPATDVLYIKGAPNGSSISISNIWGQVLYKGTATGHEIDIRDMPAGHYVAEMSDERGQSIYKGRFTKL